jgi:hypothetical protein
MWSGSISRARNWTRKAKTQSWMIATRSWRLPSLTTLAGVNPLLQHSYLGPSVILLTDYFLCKHHDLQESSCGHWQWCSDIFSGVFPSHQPFHK